MVIVVEPVFERAGEGVAGLQVSHGDMPLSQGSDLTCRQRIIIAERKALVVDSTKSRFERRPRGAGCR